LSKGSKVPNIKFVDTISNNGNKILIMVDNNKLLLEDISKDEKVIELYSNKKQ